MRQRSRPTPAGRALDQPAGPGAFLVLWVRFDPSEPGFQFNESVAWLPRLQIGYRMGVDGISVLFVLLSTVLTPICILSAGRRSRSASGNS